MKKKISLLIGFIICFNLLIACNNGKQINSDSNSVEFKSYSLKGIKSKGKLIMGTSADFPPNEFHVLLDGKDTIVGYDISIGKYIADKLGVELEIKDMEFNNLLGGLSTGMLDIVIAGMVNEPDRDANFTKSYDIDEIHKILIRKSDKDKFQSESDFNGATLGVQTGSIQKNIAENIEGSKVKELPALNTLIMELKTEKVDGIVISKEVAESYEQTNDDIVIVEKINLTHENGGASIALKTGNDQLTEYLNEIIDELIELDLVEKWKAEAKELSDKEIKND
ncbi:transporter substrate-binding domain-containing protein [Tissierella pigra]|uniref:Transporter substrate-binding domain-containing protein n=1 Tax=Tissierella pigra TaxID=2607614 RepID=A0A6N7XV52_9FIRM|nr:transporter substrate-binding domain-containing protein [Tissierella pigra]MBU5427664.1 transporter substrate-binding domain-containing protein [Tissierella pigra]MSU00414.1 transporter substrate-binding domain-containing protein [Tissierella pigra]